MERSDELERRRLGGWSAGVLAGARETRAHQPAGRRRSGERNACSVLNVPRTGDSIELVLELDSLHLFDPQTEMRLNGTK